MDQSASIKELALALSKAQAELPHPEKGGFNPHFKSKFVRLMDSVDAARATCGKYGLAVTQTLGWSSECGVYVRTVLMHTSGEWIAGELPLATVKQDPQGQGSAISYARRYSHLAILGMAPDEDDDAEQAMKPHRQPSQAPKPPPAESAVKAPVQGETRPNCTCGNFMMVSKYNEAEWYCPKCKKKQPRGQENRNEISDFATDDTVPF